MFRDRYASYVFGVVSTTQKRTKLTKANIVYKLSGCNDARNHVVILLRDSKSISALPVPVCWKCSQRLVSGFLVIIIIIFFFTF
jgi:hypothetical protein